MPVQSRESVGGAADVFVCPKPTLGARIRSSRLVPIEGLNRNEAGLHQPSNNRTPT